VEFIIEKKEGTLERMIFDIPTDFYDSSFFSELGISYCGFFFPSSGNSCS
jgi:hypothetical protein